MTKLTLRSIRTRHVLVPLRRTLATRIGTFHRGGFLLIDVETEEGVTGRSYVFGYRPNGTQLQATVLDEIEDILRGRELAPATLYDELYRELSLYGPEGIAMNALSGFDMACWDACARAANLPLVRLLGGTPGPVQAYNSNGLGLMDPDDVAREARELVEEGGFRAVKVRLGRSRLEDDIDAIEAVRKAVSDDILLMSDFNQGLSRREAYRRLPIMDDHGLVWFEEPVAYRDLETCATLRSMLSTPIQIGENFYGPDDLATAAGEGASDFVMPDAQRIGGVTGWMRASTHAAHARLPLSSHLFPEVSSHLLRVSPGAHWLEFVDWASPVLAQPLQVRNGFVDVPDNPGNGIEWNEDAVAKFSVQVS